MEDGQEKQIQSASSLGKTEALVQQFNKLRQLKDRKLQDKAVRERDVETAKAAMREIVTELKDQGLNSTDKLRGKIESLQTELEEEVTVLFEALKGVEISEV